MQIIVPCKEFSKSILNVGFVDLNGFAPENAPCPQMKTIEVPYFAVWR